MHDKADKNSMNLCQLIPTHYEDIISLFLLFHFFNGYIFSIIDTTKASVFLLGLCVFRNVC